MILHINTKDQKTITVSLKEGKKITKSLARENEYGSQVLLPLIIKLLKTENLPAGRQGCKLETLQGIEVETGPGSFTGLRVGVSVANALGYALNIPVNSKQIEMKLVY